MSSPEGKSNYNVFVAGAGAVFEEKVQNALDYLGPAEKRYIFDINPDRVAAVKSGRGVLADVLDSPLTRNKLSFDQNQAVLAFIAVPDHLGAIKSFIDEGVTRFIVEKPLVNNMAEVKDLEALKSKLPDLKVYPLDFYIQKEAPLLVLTGAIGSNDPRWDWVVGDGGVPISLDLAGSLYEHIGILEAIDVNVLEGGKLGVPDYEKRQWLLEDKLRGGMLLDLGTHALAPVIAAKIFDRNDVTLEVAHRYALGEDKASFLKASADDIETYADALMGIRKGNFNIPLTVRVGKTFHDGGNWMLNLRGDKGRVTMGLRTGDSLEVTPKAGTPILLSLKKGSDPYVLAFQEADMYFNDYPGFDGNMQAMLDSIYLIDQIKQVADRG